MRRPGGSRRLNLSGRSNYDVKTQRGFAPVAGPGVYHHTPASTQGPVGNAEMCIIMAFSMSANPAGNRFLVDRLVAGVGGYDLFVTSSGSLRFRIIDGALATQSSGVGQIVPAGVISTVAARLTAGNIELRLNGADEPNKPHTGYTGPGSSRYAFGATDAAANPFTETVIYGVGFYEPGTVTAAMLDAWEEAIRKSNHFIGLNGVGPKFLWTGTKAFQAVSSWEPEVGAAAAALTRVGSPTSVVTNTAGQWAAV